MMMQPGLDAPSSLLLLPFVAIFMTATIMDVLTHYSYYFSTPRDLYLRRSRKDRLLRRKRMKIIACRRMKAKFVGKQRRSVRKYISHLGSSAEKHYFYRHNILRQRLQQRSLLKHNTKPKDHFLIFVFALDGGGGSSGKNNRKRSFGDSGGGEDDLSDSSNSGDGHSDLHGNNRDDRDDGHSDDSDSHSEPHDNNNNYDGGSSDDDSSDDDSSDDDSSDEGDDESYDDETDWKSIGDEEDCDIFEEQVMIEEQYMMTAPGDGNDPAMKKVLEKLNDLGEALVAKHLVYLPGTDLDEVVKEKLQHISNIKKVAVVYYRFRTNKAGRSVVPSKRWEEYEKGDDFETGETIAVIFNYDTVDKATMDEIDASLEAIAKLDGVKIDDKVLDELTYNTVEELEREGLCYHTRLLLQSRLQDDLLLAKEEKKNEASIPRGNLKDDADYNEEEEEEEDLHHFGGLGRIAGFKRNFNLNNCESAIQTLLAERLGDKFDHRSACHEHLNCNLSIWEREANKECNDFYDKFILLLTANEKQAFKEKLVHSMLSWPRRNEKKRDLDSCKVFIQKFILGIKFGDSEETVGVEGSDGRICDAIQDPPPHGTFGSESYTDDDLKDGLNNMTAFVKQIEDKGGIATLDTNRIVMDYVSDTEGETTTMTHWLKKRGWKRFFVCMDLEVFRFGNEKEDGSVRLLLVHRPLCYMFYSGKYTNRDGSSRNMTWEDVKSQATRAKTGHLIFLILSGLRGEQSDEGRQNPSVWGNLLSAFAMRLFIIWNVHNSSKPAALVAKNMIDRERNLYQNNYHGMPVSKYLNKRDKNLVGELLKRDEYVATRMLNCLSDSEIDVDVRVSEVVDVAYTHITDNNRLSQTREPKNAELQVNNLEDLIGSDHEFMKKIWVEFKVKTDVIQKDKLTKAMNKMEDQYSSDSAAASSDS